MALVIVLLGNSADAEGMVQLYGTFEVGKHVHLVMEHCTAGDLFKTMLVHGGVLDEHWVAVQVPLIGYLPMYRVVNFFRSIFNILET